MPEQKKKTVLLVDDESLWLNAAKEVIVGLGFRAIVVASGEEALQALSKDVPDVIITDVRMPVMNGFDLYVKVRENPDWRNVPIIFMSAIDDYDAKKVAHDLGVSGYITKPFGLEDLKQAMNASLKNL